jgi:hypothetical protein
MASLRLAVKLSSWIAAGLLIGGAGWATAQGDSSTASIASGKKGIGLAESSGLGAVQLTALQVAWFYNWGARTRVEHPAAFVPMAFSPKRLAEVPDQQAVVLGFNEPDNTSQANVSPEQAAAAWPALRSKAQRVVSPALAKNPLSSGNWLSSFWALGASTDFVAVHWYKGADPQKFIRDIQAICQSTGQKIWVTEFAPQTAAQARLEPEKFSQSQVDRFIKETTTWMAQSSCVQRYAWHDAKMGTSALWNQGQLTATGLTYAAVPP